MSVFRHVIRPTETERFSMASGPVKIIMRGGEKLDEPEVVVWKPDETSVYDEHRDARRRKASDAKP